MMYKIKFFLDFQKEEKWLESMANKGYHFQRTFMGYHFQRGNSKMETIKIDFRKFRKREDFIDYCTLFEDSGWKHLAGSKSSGMQYFKKVEDSAGDDIFSDPNSKAARYKRYAKMCNELALSFIPFLLIFFLSDTISIKGFINPKDLYFTPGLWDKEGVSFWFSFLFETPFALMRGYAWSFIPITIILYLFFGYKSNKLYLQNKKVSNES